MVRLLVNLVVKLLVDLKLERSKDEGRELLQVTVRQTSCGRRKENNERTPNEWSIGTQVTGT